MDSIDYYNQNASDYYESTITLDMTELLERFTKSLPEGAAILDLGCGSGRDSLYFIEQGFDVTAVDGSEELCELAKIHIGQDVLQMNFMDINFKNVFDGVWACASLLHVPKEDINSILEKVIRSIKEGGILYMSFQYGEFEGTRDLRYFHDYNTRGLKELLGQYDNMEIIDIFKTDDCRKNRKNIKWIQVLARKLGFNE